MAGKIYITEEGKKNNSTEKKTYQRADGTTVVRPSAARIPRTGEDSKASDKKASKDSRHDEEIESYARELLRKKEQRRRIVLIACGALMIASFGIFLVFYAIDKSNSFENDVFRNIKNQATIETNKYQSQSQTEDEVIIHYDDEKVVPDVLPEFEELLKKNSKIVGWITIEDSKIDYPVAQTTDNEYYLNHNLDQKEDRNGTIFLDTNCDIIEPSTNLILYGHHMQSGNMFGGLGKYEDEKYYEKHKYITFDTLYEHGTYEVMYVFRSHVFAETEVAFKYYQFIDAYSEVEFDSYMQEMADMSFYDTGVTASYGDRLLTLSTCDYQEKDGRFVVVAKKIK